jgi:hypothetical protein
MFGQISSCHFQVETESDLLRETYQEWPIELIGRLYGPQGIQHPTIRGHLVQAITMLTNMQEHQFWTQSLACMSIYRDRHCLLPEDFNLFRSKNISEWTDEMQVKYLAL